MMQTYLIPMCLDSCGLQCEREAERQVSWEDASAWARAHGLRYVELSSRTDENIANTIATLIV